MERHDICQLWKRYGLRQWEVFEAVISGELWGSRCRSAASIMATACYRADMGYVFLFRFSAQFMNARRGVAVMQLCNP